MTDIKLNKKIRWINLINPKEREIKSLGAEFKLHPLIIDELIVPSDRMKIENYDDYIFMVYHLPIYDPERRTCRRAEIDFIATLNTLITVSYEEMEPLTLFERELETKLKNKINSTAEIIYYVIEEAHTFALRQLKHIERNVNFVGDQLFKKQNRKLLEEISYIKRDILDFSIIAAPQRNVLESLLHVGVSFWDENSKIYFTGLASDLMKVHFVLENLKATIESYSQTISQIFEFKTSEIIRRFSILGFLTFPLILYTTVVLQPKIEAQLIATPQDFWFQFGGVVLLTVILAIFFRKKGWF